MSGFARNVLVLGSGNVVAQVISVLAVPVLTRLYSPLEFGAFSLMFSLVAVAYPVATLRLNSAILLPEDETTADTLLLLSVISVIAVSVLVMPVVAITLHGTAPLDEPTRAVLWFLVAGVLVHGLVQCLELWLLRHRRYPLMAWGAVGESVTDRLFAIVMGLAQTGLAAWLALGRVVGGMAHLLILAAGAARAGHRPAIRAATRESLEATLRRYRQFPLYSTWALLFANGGREVPTLVLGALFSATVAGMYALGVRVLGFPSLLIGDAVAKVFFRHATDIAGEPQRLSESTGLLVRFSVYMMFPPMLLLSVVGPQLFQWVFGQAWLDAGRFAQILAMSFLVTFLYRVLGVFFDMYERQNMRLVFDTVQFAARVGAMMVGGLQWGVEGALWGLLASTIFVHGIAVIYLLSLIGLDAAATLALFAAALVTLLPLSVIVLQAQALAGAGAMAWALAGLGLLFQALWLLWREPRLLDCLRQRLR